MGGCISIIRDHNNNPDSKRLRESSGVNNLIHINTTSPNDNNNNNPITTPTKPKQSPTLLPTTPTTANTPLLAATLTATSTSTPSTPKSGADAKGSETLTVHDLDVIFVDCDDTLYFNNWATAVRLKNTISDFTSKRLGLEESYAWQLYKTHGTALRGLLQEKLIPKERIEEYLHAVHDIPLDEIARNPELREMFLTLGVRRFVFTASSREHAMRCMKRVGVDDLFEGIIDCRDVDLVTKHDPSAFRLAMERAQVTDASRCLLLDDSIHNIKTAKSLGMKTCLVGLYDRETGKRIDCKEADYEINRLIELRDALPNLFTDKHLSEIGGKRFSIIARRRLSVLPLANMKPQVVFVLGPPGSGKGTQCIKASQVFRALHLSAGDLLREEQAKPDSEHGKLISDFIKEGKIVPVEITVKLLLKSIHENKSQRVLIDGFPRSIDNLDGWYRVAHDEVNTLGCLYFAAEDEEELQRRIIERGKTSGRADDDVEVLKKRFKTMNEVTMPVIKRLEFESTVRKVNAVQSKEDVWKETEMALDGWWAEAKENDSSSSSFNSTSTMTMNGMMPPMSLSSAVAGG
jgi:pyrimidine 5'-nucleotidase